MVSKGGTIFPSQSINATGGLPRVPYDRILYGDALAKELEEDAALYRSPELIKQDPQFSLGASGCFGQVAQVMPLEMVVERRVYGPAYSKAVGHARDLLFNNESCDNSTMNDDDVYESRNVAHNLIRDEITFMPALEKDVTLSIDPTLIETQGRRPKQLVGKILDEKEILDEGHLTVREQLCDRLVKVDKNGNIIEVPPPKTPVAFFKKDDSNTTELDPTLNTHLRDALENFKYIYTYKSPQEKNRKISHLMMRNVTELKSYQRRHKMMLLSLPQRIKKHVHKLVRHNTYIGDEVEMLDCDHPNMRLCQSIDDVYILATQNALKEGADVNFSFEGRNPIHSIFSRICKIDSGDELDCNISGLENVADILAGWGCKLNEVDSEVMWNGWAPIHYAAHYGKLKRLEWLIRCKAELDTKTKEDGCTALMMASEKGKFKHVYLLVKNGANFREKDVLGRTVLHFAAAGGDLNVVKFLVQCGCVADKLKKCQHGESPISISLRVNEACFDYLSKVSIPKRLARPYIDKLLISQTRNPFSVEKIGRVPRHLQRGYVKRKKKTVVGMP